MLPCSTSPGRVSRRCFRALPVERLCRTHHSSGPCGRLRGPVRTRQAQALSLGPRTVHRGACDWRVFDLFTVWLRWCLGRDARAGQQDTGLYQLELRKLCWGRATRQPFRRQQYRKVPVGLELLVLVRKLIERSRLPSM